MSSSIQARARATVSIVALAAATAAMTMPAAAQVYFPPKAAYQQLPSDPTTIVAGPHAFYVAPIASLYATQLNLGAFEVAKKAANDTPPYGKDAGYYPVDGLTASSTLPSTPSPNYDAYMLGQTTPVVIGPGGKLYATDKQHTDFAVYLGYKNVPNFTPYAYLLVTANYSSLTEAAFEQTLANQGLVLLENNGAAITFSQLPASLLGVGNDNYRALEYEVIKNKYPFSSLSKAALVGADKGDVPYFEFVVADSYRKAGLRYLSGADADFAANYSLIAANFVDAKTSKLIPGFILPAKTLINITQPITDATLAAAGSGFAQTAAIDANGGFSGLVTSNGGVPTFTGLIIQTGNDLGGVVQLSGVNTYHGGTVIMAGTLRVSSDANLGDPSGAINFRSIGEGNGTLQAGASFTTARNIDIQAETATIDPAGYQLTLAGVISGTAPVTFGNQSNSPGTAAGGTVTLGGTNTTEGAFSVKNGVTLQISSDANLGNNNYTNDPNGFYVGALNLSGASTLQTLASVSSQRAVNVTGSASINPFGFSSSFGTVSITDATLTIGDKAGAAAGSTTTSLANLTVGGGGTLIVDNTNAGVGKTTTVQLGGITLSPVVANYATTFDTTLTLDRVTGTEIVTQTTAPTLVNGIVGPRMTGQVGATTSSYDFLTYGATGFQTAAYTTSLATSTSTSVVKSGTAVVATATSADALNLTGTLTGAGGLTLGDGVSTRAAGLILNGGTIALPTLTSLNPTLAITTSGATNTVNAVVAATNLTKAGTGTLTLGAKEQVAGSVSVTGGTLALNAVDTIAAARNGVNLSAGTTLSIAAANTIAGLNGAGTVKTNGNLLTVGEAGAGVYSLSNATIGAGDAGSLTLNGPATLEITGGSLNYTGATTVNAGATLRLKTSVIAKATTADIALNGGSIMFDQSGGGLLTNNLTGTGDLKLISGSMTLLPNKANTYTGGTSIFYGGTLYASVAALPTGGAIKNDGSLFIDQNVASIFTGVISDLNRPGFGRVVIDDSYDAYNCPAGSTYATCQTTTANGGTSYTRAATGNVTFANQQAYTGGTVVNYGTLTLGTTNAIAASSGVTLEPNSVLALGAANQIAALNSDSTATTIPGGTVSLGANTLTIGDGRNTSGAFAGTITGTGNVATAGTGTLTLSGASTYTGTTTVGSGSSFVLASGGSVANSAVTVAQGGTFVDAASTTAPTVGAFTNNGVLDLRNGTTPGTQFYTGGLYTGGAGSVLKVNAALGGAGSTADVLHIPGASGQTTIQVTDTAPNLPGAYNPTGIPVVISSGPNSATNASNFVLAGGAIQKGLFQYQLAYQPDPTFLLVSTPGQTAFQLATMSSAVRAIWDDTTSLWLDRQADLRDRIAADPNEIQPLVRPGSAAALAAANAGRSSSYPGVWANAVGTFAHRSDTQTFSTLNLTNSYNASYQQTTGGFFGGFDGTQRGVFQANDALALGVIGGYVTSTQSFDGQAARASYEGGSVGATVTYYTHNFFLDGVFKADALQARFNGVGVGGGDATPRTSVVSYGGVIDGGYRFAFAASGFDHLFVEPIVSLAYVSSDFGSLGAAGSILSFNGNDSLRGRFGGRLGSTFISGGAYKVEIAGSAAYWDRFSGNAAVTINSGALAPQLTLTDHQLQGYGEVGLGISAISLTNGFSGFLKGEYRFASGYNAGTVKGGLRYDF